MECVVPRHSLLSLGVKWHLAYVLREIVHHALAVPFCRVQVENQVHLQKAAMTCLALVNAYTRTRMRRPVHRSVE